jgi:hypothetical protein
MYAIESLRINEPDEFDPKSKKTITATIRCDGYEDWAPGQSYGDTIAPYGRSEIGANNVYVTIDFSDEPRTVAKRIRAKIAEMKVDLTAEKLLLGKVRQLGPTALNP